MTIRTFSEMEPVAYLAGDMRLAEAYYLAGALESTGDDPESLRADIERLVGEVSDLEDEAELQEKRIEKLTAGLDDIFDLCGDPPRGRYKEIAALATSIDR